MAQEKAELLERHSFAHNPEHLGPAYSAQPEMAEFLPKSPLKDAEIVFAFLGKVIEKLDDIYQTQVEQGFTIDFYGDNAGTGATSAIIGSQNQGLYKTYNGPYLITTILATWAALAATSAASNQSTTGAANATTTQTIPAVAGQSLTVNDLNVVFSAASLNATTLTVVSGADTLYSTVLPTGTTSFQVPQALTGLPGQSIVITVTAGGAAITSTVNSTFVNSQTQTVTLQLADRTLQLTPSLGLFNPQGLEIEMARDDQIVLTVTPPAACHLEIMGNVKKRTREKSE